MASDSVARALALAALEYKESHDKGNYNEIKNKPFINNKMILGSHNANYYDLPMLNETANKIILSMSSEDYLLTAKLLNKDGDIISQDILDMPLEELVLDGRYEEDSEGGWLVLVLRNGNEIRVPLAGLIDELATTEYVDFQDDYLEYKIDSESNRLETLILNEANMRSSEDDWIHELLVDHQEAIDDEIEARELGDSELEAKIENTKLDLQNLLDSEATLRLVGDSELRGLIDSEANERYLEDQQLYASLEEEASIRSSEDEAIKQFIANNTSEFNARLLDLNNRLTSEGAIRLENDSILSDRIDSEANKLAKEIEDRALGDSEVRQLIVNEATIRYNADQALGQRIDNMSPKVDNITIKKDNTNTLSVPIDYDTISINALGQMVAKTGSTATQAYLNGHMLDSESNAESVELYWYGTDSEYSRLVSEGLINDYTMYIVDDGNKGITEIAYYDELEGKPQINGVTLSGNKSLASFGIQPTTVFGRGLRTDSEGHIHVSLRDDGVLGIDTSNRLYVDTYNRDQLNQMIANIFNTRQVASLPDPLTRNTIYFVGTQNPYVVMLADSNGDATYLGYFNLNAGLPTPTPPQTGNYKCELVSNNGVLSWRYTQEA